VQSVALKRHTKSMVVAIAVAALAVIPLAVIYVRAHPLVFNESFWGHAHCIKGGGIALNMYADDHEGKFPHHASGYGDALLLMTNEVAGWWETLTGPGYTAQPFLHALATRTHLSEEACGRVYVQGLSETNNPEVALLFDKLPTPGGDHCHGFARLTRPLVREVWTIGRGHQIIRESEWQAFAQGQVNLLVEAGLSRREAERLYAPASK